MKDISKRRLLLKSVTTSVVTLLLFTLTAFAQSDTARIEGTVTDAAGAVIAGATVTAINVEQNTRTDVVTNDEGFYTLPALRIGVYTVEVTAQGFSKQTRPDIVLQVNQVARIDAQLQAGAVTETIEVQGGAPLVENSQSQLGQVIDERPITELPLNGRNFTQLATLVPGVNRGTPGSNATGEGGNAETFRQGENGSAALSVNGLREQNNNFQLDGIDNNESIVNTITFFPPVEALDEFRVITSVAPAEFGRGGGAIVNAVLKSGKNEFFGTAFEFIRNSALDARPFFSPTKPIFQRNQFGFIFGGPLVRDRTFFFGDYQGLRQKLPREAGDRVTVPTEAFRNGDFSALLAQGIVIRDPDTGVPFVNNRIPRERFNPVGARYLNLFPLPDTSDLQRNYFVRRFQRQKFNNGDVRIDHRFGNNDQIFGIYRIARDRQTDPGRIPGFQAGFGAGTNQVEADSLVLNYTRTLSSNLVNEARFGYVKQNIQFLPVGFGTNQNAEVGIPGIGGVTADNGLSLIGGGNGFFLEYLGDFGEFTLNERTLQFSDALNYIVGNHTFKFGATVIQRNIRSIQADFNKGFYFFSDRQSTATDPPPLGFTGYEVSDILLGRTDFTTSAVPGINPATTISYENGFFAQDDWRATRRLTLNLGLRYEYFSPYYEKNNRLANFDPATGRIILAGQDGASRSTVEPDRNNFGPRLGAAYSLTEDGRTVLRGGYGVFYSLDRGGIANQLTQNPPFIITQFRFGGTPGANVRLSDPIPLPDPIDPNSPSLPLGSQIRYVPRDTQNTRVQQFNIAFEREFTNFFAVNVAYVGTRGANVTAITTQGGFGGDLATRLTTVANIGASRYNSLQVKANMRNYRGLNFLAAYTFAKATNNSPGAFPGLGAAFRQTPADPGGLAEGPADFDLRHRFTFAGTYDIPFFRDTEGLTRAIFNGFQFNTIITLQSGSPFSVFGGAGRATLTGDPNLGVDRSTLRYFDAAAFRNSADLSEQSGRNIFYGPSFYNVDMSLFRRFNITERVNLEFRAEAFNIFNRAQFNLPVNELGRGDTGLITSTRFNSQRQLQFGVRLAF